VLHGSEFVALASALEERAALIEQLGAQLKQNADSARPANQLAMNTSAVALNAAVEAAHPGTLKLAHSSLHLPPGPTL
jgi:uncharacterized protein YukE